MNLFQPAFSVMLKHDYFVDGVWRHVAFAPTVQTRKLLDAANMVCKPTANGLAVYVDQQKLDVLRLYAQAGLVHWVFTLRVQDKGYACYTAPVKKSDQMVGYFSTQRQLSLLTEATQGDFVPLEELMAQALFTPQELRIAPDFVVHVALALDQMGADYVLQFRARPSWWKYYLLGEMARKNTTIVDLDNRYEFECCGDVQLQGGQAAKLFKSKQQIPVQEKSNYRFQLKESEQRQGRVLIKRLAVASEGRLGLETIDGKRELVFENFVNF